VPACKGLHQLLSSLLPAFPASVLLQIVRPTLLCIRSDLLFPIAGVRCVIAAVTDLPKATQSPHRDPIAIASFQVPGASTKTQGLLTDYRPALQPLEERGVDSC
jgi:hypothetical protein